MTRAETPAPKKPEKKEHHRRPARRNRDEQILRQRAKELGYELYEGESGYVLARKLRPTHKREAVVGRDGPVTLDEIRSWLDEKHPEESP